VGAFSQRKPRWNKNNPAVQGIGKRNITVPELPAVLLYRKL
jgi:hypothetical protein